MISLLHHHIGVVVVACVHSIWSFKYPYINIWAKIAVFFVVVICLVVEFAKFIQPRLFVGSGGSFSNTTCFISFIYLFPALVLKYIYSHRFNYCYFFIRFGYCDLCDMLISIFFFKIDLYKRVRITNSVKISLIEIWMVFIHFMSKIIISAFLFRRKRFCPWSRGCR